MGLAGREVSEQLLCHHQFGVEQFGALHEFARALHVECRCNVRHEQQRLFTVGNVLEDARGHLFDLVINTLTPVSLHQSQASIQAIR